MSSRNAYLSADERRRALALSQSLRLAERLVGEGVRDVATIRGKMQELIREVGGVEVQYIAFVADGTVTPVERIDGPTTVAIAALVGKTRLIDNVRIGMRRERASQATQLNICLSSAAQTPNPHVQRTVSHSVCLGRRADLRIRRAAGDLGARRDRQLCADGAAARLERRNAQLVAAAAC